MPRAWPLLVVVVACVLGVPHPARADPAKCVPRNECTRTLCVDRKAFFDGFRSFYRKRWGALSQRTVCAIEEVMSFWETHDAPELVAVAPKTARGGGDSAARLSYVLATALHETIGRVYPVREGYCPDEACTIRKLEAAWRARRIRQRYWEPVGPEGQRYYGRGQIQLTHEYNYERVTRELTEEGLLAGRDLARDPDKALDLDVSVATLVLGMARGWFRTDRGRPASLELYLNPARIEESPREAFFDARHIVNGDWNAMQGSRRIGDLIADYAFAIERSLRFVPPGEVRDIDVTTFPSADGGGPPPTEGPVVRPIDKDVAKKRKRRKKKRRRKNRRLRIQDF